MGMSVFIFNQPILLFNTLYYKYRDQKLTYEYKSQNHINQIKQIKQNPNIITKNILPPQSPILINRHHIIKLTVYNPIIVQKQSLSFVISPRQKPTRRLLPRQVKHMLLLLWCKRSHLFLVFVHLGQHLIHIVYEFQPVNDIVTHFKMNA